MKPLALLAIPLVLCALPRAEAQVLTPRGDGSYERHSLPGTRDGERLRVDPLSGTSSGVIRDSEGRRAGTIERGPTGDYKVYDKDGRRVWR